MRIMMHGYLDSKNNHEYYIGFPLDVTEDDTSYTVTADLPGVEKENIKVGFLDGVLTISMRCRSPTTKRNISILRTTAIVVTFAGLRLHHKS